MAATEACPRGEAFARATVERRARTNALALTRARDIESTTRDVERNMGDDYCTVRVALTESTPRHSRSPNTITPHREHARPVLARAARVTRTLGERLAAKEATRAAETKERRARSPARKPRQSRENNPIELLHARTRTQSPLRITRGVGRPELDVWFGAPSIRTRQMRLG